MADPRCPEPKPVLIFFLACAGWAAGMAAALMDRIWGSSAKIDLQSLAFDSSMGAALGTAIGVSLASSRSLWVRIAASGVLGFVAYMCVTMTYDWRTLPVGWSRQGITMFNALMAVDGLLGGGLPVLALTAVNELFLRWRTKGGRFLLLLPLYLLVGGFSKSVIAVISYTEPAAYRFQPSAQPFCTDDIVSFSLAFHPFGLMTGAAFGLFQFFGILAALAVDRRIRPRLAPPPPAPSPGPGP